MGMTLDWIVKEGLAKAVTFKLGSENEEDDILSRRNSRGKVLEQWLANRGSPVTCD